MADKQPINQPEPSADLYELTPYKIDRAKETINERLKSSRKIVNTRKAKWDIWEKMYNNEQLQSRIRGESNLVLPKADYIAETISAKVINSIFSVADWLTMRHPNVPSQTLADQQKWFMWVMDRKVNFYLTAIEMFKASPVKGTSIAKIYMKNFWPHVEFMRLEHFLPDTLANKPGDIQSMRYCFHQFKRDLNQIKRFRGADGKPIYQNIEKLEANKEAKKTETHAIETYGTQKAEIEDKITPIYDLVEYHGEFEYEQGKFGEYILTAELQHDKDDEVETIIRCAPSEFKTRDKHSDQDIFLKPFVANIYSVNPGEFYGKSAISSVESLISEQTDLHNIYMDNHKRLVNGIVKILNRSDITRDDIPQVAGATWFLDSFDDVEVETPPETNLVAYKTIHELLDREIEKASAVSSRNLGVGSTKRETYGEVRSLLNESNERFQLFIQMADRITLRPLAYRVYALLRQTFNFYQGKDFIVDGKQMSISKDNLLEDMDVQFSATTVESEHSKYSKQQTLPQVIQLVAQLAGGRLNVDALVKEIGELYNYKDPERFLNPSDSIPIAMLPPELQGLAQQIMAQAAEEEGGGKGAPPQLSASPSLAPAAEGGGY